MLRRGMNFFAAPRASRFFSTSSAALSPFVRQDIRNLAVIAHVDHGKTTLVDNMMKFATGKEINDTSSVLDCFQQERERGITILAKNTAIPLKGHPATLNVVDTPGHLDFGGEVERTLQMVESFLLLVDAADGVMPGTRYVLRKALELRLRPLVFINKIDREAGDIAGAVSAIEDLFLDLAVDDSQLDYPILYGSGRAGIALAKCPSAPGPAALAGGQDLQPLFDAIYKHVPPPVSRTESKDAFSMLVTNLGQEPRIGQTAVVRVFSGEGLVVGKKGTAVRVFNGKTGTHSDAVPIAAASVFNGTAMEHRDTLSTGDIVRIHGLPPLDIGDTIYSVPDGQDPVLIPYKACDPPAIMVPVSVNTASHRGQDTENPNGIAPLALMNRIRDEVKTNLALAMEPRADGGINVSGRGTLHLGVLFEELRREGFEIEVRKPTVITRVVDGVECEPLDDLTFDVKGEYLEGLTTLLAARNVDILDMTSSHDGLRSVVKAKATTRSMLGFGDEWLSLTRGDGVWRSEFAEYVPVKGKDPARARGAMVANGAGRATLFGLDGLRKHGTFFIGDGESIVANQVIGEANGGQDMVSNPCKEAPEKGARNIVKPAPVPTRKMSVEAALMWIDSSELVEITPKSMRIRKLPTWKFGKANAR